MGEAVVFGKSMGSPLKPANNRSYPTSKNVHNDSTLSLRALLLIMIILLKLLNSCRRLLNTSAPRWV